MPEARSAPQVHRGQARRARKKAELTRGASARLQQAPPRRAARPLAHPYSCWRCRQRGVLGWPAMFAGNHFVSQKLKIGCHLVNLSACCNDHRSSSGFRRTSKRSFNSDKTAVVTRIAVRAPLTTDDDDERRTIQDGRQSRSYGRSEHAVPPVGGYRPLGMAPAPLLRGRRVAVHSSGRPRGPE